MPSIVHVTLASVFLLTGCERKPDSASPGPVPSATPPATAPGVEPSPADTGVRQPQGVDREDDPAAPRALPNTRELRGWIKSEPVRVFPSDRLEAALDDPAKARTLATFHLKRAARCTYQHDTMTAQVLLIEAASPEDAFGVFSIQTTEPGTLYPADGTIRAIESRPDGAVLTGWQGDTFVQIRCSGAESQKAGVEECEGLLIRILFNLPSAEAPWLLRAIQSETGQTVKLWLVHATAPLVATGHPVLSQIDPEVMDARLGLKGDALLVVASVQVTAGEPPNLIWLARYENETNAQGAGARYQEALQTAQGRLDANTFLDDPKGLFLTGSWTADQESIQKLLPKLRAVLPE